LIIVISPFLSRESSKYDEIWYANTKFDPGNGSVRKFQKFSNSRWRTNAILKIIFGYNPAPSIWSRVIATRNLELGGIIAHIRRFGDKNVQFRISNMAEGRHFENHYISISQPQIVRISQNLVCRQILPQATESDKNSDIRKFKMADGRRIDNHFLAITQLHCPIKMKFGVRRENHTNTKQVR